MICANNITKKRYKYTFVEDGKVELESDYDIFSIPYEEWKDEYYVVKKL